MEPDWSSSDAPLPPRKTVTSQLRKSETAALTRRRHDSEPNLTTPRRSFSEQKCVVKVVCVGAQLSANQLFLPFWRPPSARCCCLEEVSVCWTMSGSRTPPEGCEGPVQGPCQASYRWHHYRKPWQRSDPHPAPEQPLDRYKWRTSACLAPRAAKMATPQGKGQSRERPHLQMLSLPRFNTNDRGGDQSSAGQEGQTRPSSLRRIFPYLRSMSEPGTGSDPGRTAVRKVGSDAERRTPSVSSFITSFSRRISRVLRDQPETEEGESGRRDNIYLVLLSVHVMSVCHVIGLKTVVRLQR